MLIILLVIVVFDILFFLTLLKRRILASRTEFSVILALSIIHTTLLLVTLLKIVAYRGDFAENSHLANYMTFTLLLSAGTIPKIIYTIFSNLAWAVRKRFRSLAVFIQKTAVYTGVIVIILVMAGNLYGRFNFKTEVINLTIDNLPVELKGLRIVQVSDLHLNSFHMHGNKLAESARIINDLQPDILVNTGDYVSYGYREMEPFNNAINFSKGRYGNFAILGNHDMGTYHPGWDLDDRKNNVERISGMISNLGFTLLNDENRELRIGNSTVSVIGITTSGSIPDITYGDFEKAKRGSDSADLRIFLSHDPNFWLNNRESTGNIEITLSGHTHGMQLGIITKRLRLSPASLIFPAWNGLYGESNNWLYVNRGLGTLGFPFRIGMPPEITLIILE